MQSARHRQTCQSSTSQAVWAVCSSRTCDRNVADRDGALVEAGCDAGGKTRQGYSARTQLLRSLTEHLHLQLGITIPTERAVVQHGVTALPPAVERNRVLEERILHDRTDCLRLRNLRHRNIFSVRSSSAEQMII